MHMIEAIRENIRTKDFRLVAKFPKGYDLLFRKLQIVKQILALTIIGIVNGTMWRTYEYWCSLCFDSQVAAVQQSPEFRFGIRKNAKMDNGETQRRNLFSS